MRHPRLYRPAPALSSRTAAVWKRPPRPGEPALAARLYEQYLWSPRYVDAPILRDRDSDSDGDPGDGSLGQAGSGLDERLYYTGDVLTFSTLALVEADGDVVERYVYDPYGRARIYSGDWATDRTATGSAYDNEIRYGGYRFDPETGLYHVRHRMYHPTLGRWLQRDPLGYVDGMSLYAYVGGNPSLFLDPLGQSADARRQMRFLAGMYKSEQRDAQRSEARAERCERKADALEREARRFADKDPEKKKELLGRARALRESAETLRGEAAEHEQFMKEIEAQAQQILDGLGAGGGRVVGGGGGDDGEWYDKTWYDGNPYGDFGKWDYTKEFAKGMVSAENEGWKAGALTVADAYLGVFTLGFGESWLDDAKGAAWRDSGMEGTWAHTGSEIGSNVSAFAAAAAVGCKVSGVNPSFKVGIHGPHHSFPLVGNVPHLQGIMWQPGVSQSHHILRIPLTPWWP